MFGLQAAESTCSLRVKLGRLSSERAAHGGASNRRERPGQLGMSAFPPKADILSIEIDVRFVPLANIDPRVQAKSLSCAAGAGAR